MPTLEETLAARQKEFKAREVKRKDAAGKSYAAAVRRAAAGEVPTAEQLDQLEEDCKVLGIDQQKCIADEKLLRQLLMHDKAHPQLAKEIEAADAAAMEALAAHIAAIDREGQLRLAKNGAADVLVQLVNINEARTRIIASLPLLFPVDAPAPKLAAPPERVRRGPALNSIKISRPNQFDQE